MTSYRCENSIISEMMYRSQYTTLWCGVLLEKLIVCQLLQKFHTLNGNRRFITVFTKTRNWIPTWASSIQFPAAHTISLRSILILHPPPPHKRRCPEWHLLFSNPNFVCFSHFAVRTTCSNHQSDTIGWTFPPPFYYLLFLTPPEIENEFSTSLTPKSVIHPGPEPV